MHVCVSRIIIRHEAFHLIFLDKFILVNGKVLTFLGSQYTLQNCFSTKGLINSPIAVYEKMPVLKLLTFLKHS